MPGGVFCFLFVASKPVRLALPKTRPTLYEKILGGIFEPNEIKTDHES